jgi:cob(I)alamin adenosyltransferase
MLVLKEDDVSKDSFYTGRGDGGDTVRLGGGSRLSKSAALLEVVGTLDETSAALGMARAHVQAAHLPAILRDVQRHLSQLMAHVSATPAARARYDGLGEAEVAWLEAQIAALSADLPPLTDFVLPGDSVAGAMCHLARTTARRAERRLVAFREAEAGIGPANLAYLNRLSSLLFVAALCEDAANAT